MDDALSGQVDATAAEIYDEFFVPALFGQWPEQLLDAAGVGEGDRVLDVGCGTGIVARAASARVGDSGRVVGLDPNEGMLAVSRRSPADVEWRAGVAEQLPFDAESFDRVVSQFVLMFLADRPRALDEMARVLAGDGTIAVATWASVEESPGYAAMVELLRDIVGEQAAAELEAPFCLGTAAVVEELLSGVFDNVTVTRRAGVAHFESIEAWVHTDVRGWTLSGSIDDEQYARLLDAATAGLATFVDGDGRVHFPAPALIATARRR